MAFFSTLATTPSSGVGGQVHHRGDLAEGIIGSWLRRPPMKITSGSQAMTASKSASLMVPKFSTLARLT